MKVLTQGHKYVAQNFEDKESGQTIQFIEKEALPGLPLNTINDGTTNEEVLEILINRVKFLNNKYPCKENAMCITHMEEALMWLEKRTKDRIKRDVEGKQIA